MWETEILKFAVLGSVILLIFIWGIILFIVRYQKRKLMFEKEKAAQDERHFRELLYTKLEIQQHTMRDIGREIHDNVGQRLTLAAMYIYQLEFEKKATEEGERISGIGKILDESLEELRNLSKSLTNVTAEKWELKELVEHECSRVNALNICQVSSSFSEGDYSVSPAIKSFLHRIIQEFLQNSLKHSRCKHIRFNFERRADGLYLAMADDGVGFDVAGSEAGGTKGIGLSNMKMRAELLGVNLELHSAPGAGTTLKLHIPEQKLNA